MSATFESCDLTTISIKQKCYCVFSTKRNACLNTAFKHLHFQWQQISDFPRSPITNGVALFGWSRSVTTEIGSRSFRHDDSLMCYVQFPNNWRDVFMQPFQILIPHYAE